MLILVVNCGSSSAKYELFDVREERSICRGVVERIGGEGSVFKCETLAGGKSEKEVACPDHHRAVWLIKEQLEASDAGLLAGDGDLVGVGHRVVHGGEEFYESVLIGDEVLRSIEKYSDLAPLHNPPSLEGIRASMKYFPGIPQVAVFDTAFHQTMPKHAYCYGVPYEFYQKYGIRRYGFHGTSHRYVSAKAAEELGKPLEGLRIITAHLGNGCSMAAVSGGKVLDTSMGFTPLEGLLMGTRSGDLDPAVVFFLMQKEGLDINGINSMLNKESGLLGVSGISNDMRDVLRAMDEGDEKATLAYDIFVYRILKYAGAYAAVLGNVDAMVFTAGIGENVPRIKDSIKTQLKTILPGTKFLTIATNEELLIAKDTYGIVREKR